MSVATWVTVIIILALCIIISAVATAYYYSRLRAKEREEGGVATPDTATIALIWIVPFVIGVITAIIIVVYQKECKQEIGIFTRTDFENLEKAQRTVERFKELRKRIPIVRMDYDCEDPLSCTSKTAFDPKTGRPLIPPTEALTIGKATCHLVDVPGAAPTASAPVQPAHPPPPPPPPTGWPGAGGGYIPLFAAAPTQPPPPAKS